MCTATVHCIKAYHYLANVISGLSLSVLLFMLLSSVYAFWVTVCKMVRPMLSDHCPLCRCVTLVYCGHMVGWINMSLGMEVGLSPGHIVLDGDPAAAPNGHSPQFLTHVYCGQTAGWIKMPLGTDVGLGPGDIVLDGTQLPHPKKVPQQPPFSTHVYCSQTAVHLSNC